MLFVLLFAAFFLRLAPKRTAFSTKTHCVQHQNALRLAPKYTAFSTKMHHVQHQNAPRLAPKCTIFGCKQPQTWCKLRFYAMCIHFACIHMLPLFASKLTSARIDFLRQGGRLVSKKGTQNVKIYTENQTKKTIMPHTCAWLTARKARTLTTAGESGCSACCSQPTETTSWKHRSNLPLTTSFATYRECITPNRPLNRLSNILSCYPLFSVLLSLACRLLTCLILLTQRATPLILWQTIC